MGTEYCLGCHGKAMTPQGVGVSLMAYEMSGALDVYADMPKEKVDVEAWEDAARINLWEKVNPSELFRIGLNIIQIAKQHMSDEEARIILDNYGIRITF